MGGKRGVGLFFFSLGLIRDTALLTTRPGKTLRKNEKLGDNGISVRQLSGS
jgi:hypothetical protein